MCENEKPPPRCPPVPYGGVEKVWRETQQLMDKSERLFRIMTHVCPQQLTGVFRTVAKYSQGCWRRCTADAGEYRGPPRAQQEEHHCGRCECRRVARAGQEEGEGEGVPEDGSYLWRGWRRRRVGCQCQPSTSMDTWGSAGPPPPAVHHLCYPAHTHAQASTRSHTPKWRTSLPSHSSILTIILLLVVTLARFTAKSSVIEMCVGDDMNFDTAL
ncbi:hypothetical protein Pcinc_019576 [Petrolisthes cinctipes]|uniref:Uncharacterized protein n=1 Tax=Petrolisthes cinctipes TaxID=88211 RepID=A0AAE1KHJ6_PETCI|nr:hypothetical protein Pcinc_019576 [Petrolisthes cinctipes]